MRPLLIGLLVVTSAPATLASSGVVYRAPDSYSELPPPIVAALDDEGCRVPQGTIEGQVVATNVISGSFAATGQLDWAVLCAGNGHQYIRVFWGGSTTCPTRIDKGPMMSEAELKRGLAFDRAIDTVDRKFIVDHYEAYGGPKPPDITHLGINYAYLERASVVHYCHEGKWLSLTGAD